MSTLTALNSRDAYLTSQSPRLKVAQLPPNFEVPGLKKLTLSQSAPYFTTEPLPSATPYGPTQIVITAELTAITGTPVFTVVAGANRLQPGPTADSRILDIADMTAQSAVISVSVEDTSTFKETPTAPNKVFTADTTIAIVRDGLVGADGDDGADGHEGITVSLSMDASGFHYRADGTSPQPGTANFTAQGFNLKAGLTPYYQFYENDVLKQESVSSVYTFTPPVSADELPVKVEVAVREDGPESKIIARDMYVVGGVVPGRDAVNVFLSNTSHSVPVTAGGVADYSGSGTEIEVWEGDVRLTPVTPETDNGDVGTYVVAVSGTGITAGTVAVQTDKVVVSDHEALQTAAAAVTYSLTIHTLSGDTIVRSQQQSITRAVQGQDGIVNQSRTAGINKRTVSLSTQTPVVVYTASGDVPVPSTVAFTTDVKNFDQSATLYYQFFVNGVAQQSGISGAFDFASPAYFNYFSAPIEVLVKVREGSLTAPVLAQDLVAIKPAKQGDRTITAAMLNASHALPTDFAEVVDYSGSGTDIVVYEGGTKLTVAPIGAGTYSLTLSGTNVTPGAISNPDSYTSRVSDAADMVSDQAVVAAIVTVRRLDGATSEQFTVYQRLAKSREIIQGTRGPGHFYATGSTWSDATANSVTPGDNVKDDVVTISNGSSFAMTKLWNGTSWTVLGVVIDGTLLVSGTVAAAAINANGLSIKTPDGTVILDASAEDGVHLKNMVVDGALMKVASVKSASIESLDADKINATTLSAIVANLGTITAGRIKSQNGAVDIDLSNNSFSVASGTTGARLVMQNNVIKVYDENNVLRVKLGDLSA